MAGTDVKDKKNTGKNAQVDPDSDSADIPPFAQGKTDPQTYLRLREEHIKVRRGLNDAKFDPRARVNAIHNLEQREKVLKLLNKARNKSGNTVIGTADSQDTSDLAGSGVTGVSDGTGSSLPSIQSPSIPAWTPIGPAPIPNGQTTTSLTVGEQPVSGRVTAIAVHPTNPNTVYVGTAQGGVYRTLDGGTTWTAIFDNAASLAIGAIAIAPSQTTTIFVGTGEANLSADSYFGVGLYRIDDSEGNGPTLVGPLNLNGSGFDVFTGRSISKILVKADDANQILVASSTGIGGVSGSSRSLSSAANAGVYRSINALASNPTFSQLTVFVVQPVATTVQSRRVSDMVMDQGDTNTVLAAVFGANTLNDGGVFRTTNAWAATPIWTNTFTTSEVGIKLAINSVVDPNTNNRVVTALVAYGGTTVANGAVRKSTDGGATFGSVLTAANNFCNGQCFYDIAPALDPNDANIIYLGGSSGSNILKKSTNGGTNFSRIDTGLHADTHAVSVAPSDPNTVYFGSDGGIWKSTNKGGTWTSLNTVGFNATQFESVATHPADRNFSIGGTQDNGTPFFQADGTWTRADFGDGGFALIDQSAVDTTAVNMYHTYFNQTNNLVGYARVFQTADAHEANWDFVGCNGNIPGNGISCGDTVLFYAPMATGPGSPNTVYYGSNRLYRSIDRGTNMVVVSQSPLQSGAAISAIGISPQNDNVRIVGLNTGRVFATTTGSSTMINVTGSIPAKYIARAVIDPSNPSTAFVTLSGFNVADGQHIWKTPNLGTTPFSPSGAGIPDIPVNAFVIDPLDSNSMFAGTDIGVYHSADGGVTWDPYGSGLPRVAVFDMSIQNSNRVLRIATHGRGMWENTVPQVPQIITFAAIPNHVTTDAPFTVSASASSGLPVTLTVLSGPATIVGNTITLTGATGTVVVEASQAGNNAFGAATSVDRSFTVNTPFVQLITTAVLTKTGSGYSATVTITNNGNVPATAVQLTAAKLGTPNGAPIPQSLGTIAPNGGTAGAIVNFPASAGVTGASVIERLTGTSNGGSFGGSFRVTLP